MNGKNIIDEIQFLRSISIIFVILFHFELLNFNGGFIGVDIFFTISGFLITSIILKEKKFSFANFYFKRAKRILPSLYLLIFVSLILGYFVLSPLHFEILFVSSNFSLAALSNYFFYQEVGYFDQNKIFKPLLHTWSLAVEIQYYILWPIILIILKNFFRNLFWPIFLILIFCLTFSLLYSNRTEGFFYFTGFRIYEFCVGSLTYLIIKKKRVENDFLSFSGFIIIVLCGLFYNNSLGLPGAYLILPCVGASLVIIFKIPKKISFIKENFFLNYTAIISYTLYLFHWPILIFYSYQKSNSPELIEKIILIITTYIISILVYEIYEKKIRYLKSQRVNIFLTSILVLPFIFYFLNSIINLENKKISETFKKNEIIKEVFEGRKIKNEMEDEIILKIKQNKYFVMDPEKKNIIVLGDSHAFDLFLSINSLKKIIMILVTSIKILNTFIVLKRKKLNDEIIDFLNSNILKRKNSCKIVLNGLDKSILRNAHVLVISNRWPKEIDYKKVVEYFYSINKNLILISNGHRFYDIPTLFFKKGERINDYAKNTLSKNQIQIPEIEYLQKKYQIKF